MPPANKKAATLRLDWERAVERDRPKDALVALEQLEMVEPKEARWPHRAADVLRRMGRTKDAELAYDRAMALYEKQGFVARAVAVAKIIATLNPARADALAAVNHQAVRDLRAATKPPPVLTPPPEPGMPGAFEFIAPAARTPPMPIAPPMPPVAPLSPRGASSFPASSIGYIAGLPAEDVALVASALPLEIAVDVGPDEVRFADVPSGRGSDVDLSEFAVAEQDYGPAADEFDVLESPTAERLSLMSGAVLFADVPAEVASEIARAADLVDLAPEAIVYRMGAAADSLYIIVDGMIRESHDSRPNTGATLTEGEVFGEECLLEGSFRPWDVRAAKPLLALRIPKSRLDTIVRNHPSIGEVLFELLIKRLVANTIHSSPMFSAFDPITRGEIANLFEVRRAAPGTVLKEHGKRGDGLYILLVGGLERERPGERSPVPAGSVFGQSSLLSPAADRETIRVVREAIVLRLPAARIGTFVMQYPPALAHLAELGPG